VRQNTFARAFVGAWHIQSQNRWSGSGDFALIRFLLEQSVSKEAIKRRLKIQESERGGDIKDCYLWKYVHREAEPNNYHTQDVVLNPIE